MGVGRNNGDQSADQGDKDGADDGSEKGVGKGQAVRQNAACGQTAEAEALTQPDHALLIPISSCFDGDRCFFVVVKLFLEGNFLFIHVSLSFIVF